MWLIVISLAAGVIIGVTDITPAAWLRHLDKGITITLFIMLLALGAQIGSNAELVANLPVLGWRAAVISALSITGSVAVLWLVVSRWMVIKERKEA